MASHHHCFKEKEKLQEGNEKEDDDDEIKKRVGGTSNSVPTTESELHSSSLHHHAGPTSLEEETLVVQPSSLVHLHHTPNLKGSSNTDQGGEAESKDPVGPNDKLIIQKKIEAPEIWTENQLQVSVCSSPSSGPLPVPVAQPLSSAPSPNLPRQRLLPPKVHIEHLPEIDSKAPKGGKTLPPVSARASASDGYNWRKYGQKQVKSPTGSRSYYRCTHSDCSAKKIEFSDHSGQMIEIVYKNQHGHDPPQKTNSIRESKFVLSNESTVESSVPEQPIRVLNDSGPSPSSKEPEQEAPCRADKEQQNSSSSENGKIILKEEHSNEPELKRRPKIDELPCLESPEKPGKKPKLVVHADGDVGISGDGYRWRKYGQKMVKGNPHPRNYYRCTSAGCPVRKHIESAADNSNAAIITYKGVHDHDMPVPKKRHGLPSAPLVAAAAPASMNNLKTTKTDSLQNQKTSTRWSVDTEGELTGEALDLGGEKAIESARTLLSIGFEIKPC